MKLKIQKHRCDKSELINCSTKIKLKWGFGHIWAQQLKTGLWNLQVYWSETNIDSGLTVYSVKKQSFENIEDAMQFGVGVLTNYFEEHPILMKIYKNIDILEEIRGTY